MADRINLSIHPRNWPEQYCPGREKSTRCTKPPRRQRAKDFVTKQASAKS